jgi:hypothetical protein
VISWLTVDGANQPRQISSDCHGDTKTQTKDAAPAPLMFSSVSDPEAHPTH